MARVFRVASGKVAIWDDASNDAPFTNPLGNLSRVKYHSDLGYTQIIDVRDVTLNLPPIANVLQGTASHQLFAHGRGGVPFILGKVTVGGQPCAFTGSVPVQMGTAGASGFGYYGRWLALGADATHVYAYEYYVCVGNSGGSSSTWETYPALSLPITVYVTDELL